MNQSLEFKQQVIIEFSPIVYKVLKSFSIYPNHMFYEDYLQELSIKLLDLAESFEGDIFGDCRFQFVAYGRKGLTWFLRDLLVKQTKLKTRSLDNLDLQIIPEEDPHLSRSILVKEFLQEAQALLSKKEYGLLRLLIQYPVADIAKHLSLSRQAVYNKRQMIQKKLSSIKSLLTFT